jgi:EpsI family protein
VGVFLTIVLAIKLEGKGRQKEKNEIHQVSDSSDGKDRSKSIATASVLAMLVLFVTAGYLFTWNADPIRLEQGFTGFPMQVENYRGNPVDKLDKPFYSDLAHQEMIREYVNPAGDVSRVYIGYFQFQNQEKELIDYRYNWLHEDAAVLELQSSPPLVVKKKSVKTKTGINTAFFYYDINGRHIINTKHAKLASLADALFSHRTNGAIVIVNFEKDIGELSAEQETFLKGIAEEARKVLR